MLPKAIIPISTSFTYSRTVYDRLVLEVHYVFEKFLEIVLKIGNQFIQLFFNFFKKKPTIRSYILKLNATHFFWFP